MVRLLTRLEGLAILTASLYFYTIVNGNWILFIILLLAPDLSMIGYLKNKQIGALSYNIIHNFFSAFVVITIGFFANQTLIQQFGIILLAHVGMDRVFGFGLKYKEDFKSTHIQKL